MKSARIVLAILSVTILAVFAADPLIINPHGHQDVYVEQGGLNRRVAVTGGEVVVATNATETGLTVDLVGDARSQRPLSGKYWAVATMTPSGRLNFVSRSGSLAGSDFSVPHDLTEEERHQLEKMAKKRGLLKT